MINLRRKQLEPLQTDRIAEKVRLIDAQTKC